MSAATPTAEILQRPGGTMPTDYARSLVRPPVVSSDGHGWQHLLLHRFQVPYLDVKLGASCMNRITINLAGSVLVERKHETGHDRRWSNSGTTTLIPAGVPMTRSFKGQADFMVIYLTRGIVADVAADVMDLDQECNPLVESFNDQDETIERFGRLFLAEAEHGGAGTRLFTDALTRALALHLLRTYSAGSPRPPVLPNALVGWRLRRAIEYMHAHISEDMPLAQLAAASGLSQSHFTRAFRAATGKPPHRYLIRLRVDKARHLLEHTRLPIIDIGLRCGFEQATHFATMFRKITGLSPSSYRAARCS